MATPTVETAIWSALKARITSIPGSYPTAWPNQNYTPVTGTDYLRIDLIPNRTLRRFIGPNDPHHYRGILQIGVMTKLNEQIGIAIEKAGDVADHFPTDLLLTSNGVTIRITGHPSIGPSMPQATHLMTPVSIEFETYQ